MKINFVKTSILSFIAAAIIATPVLVRAQDATTNTPAATAPAKHKKHGVLPFHGKVAALDTKAMTLTVGKLLLQVTSETKITKDGKPATLDEGAVGDKVGGAYKKDADGKLTASSIHFGIKAGSKKTK